jgi:hypothetical protein
MAKKATDSFVSADAEGFILFEPEDGVDPDDVRNPRFSMSRKGCEIREPSGRQPPKAVYLVYIKFDENGQLVVRQAFSPFESGETVEAAEKRVFKRIEAGKYDDINFENMTWKKPCYLTYVLANPGWKFYWRNSDIRHAPMRFFRRKNKIPPTTKIYRENHAFFDAARFDMFGKLSAFRCVNFVCDEDGKLGDLERIDYCFQVYLEAPFSLAGKERNVIMLIDPDGQNQGPKV